MRKSIVYIITVIAVILVSGYSRTANFILVGEIESIRKDNLITIIFKEKPDKDSYLITVDDRITGNISIISINSFKLNRKIVFRALAEYRLTEQKDLIKSGTFISLLKDEERTEPVNRTELTNSQETIYKDKIFTDIDGKEMILIPSGKFVFGFNSGEKDEAPEQIIKLDDFYVDKYEVSNSDYYVFVNKTNSKPPISWIDGKFKEGEDNFPVMVSYYEAVKYADWTLKRLPTEEEWEKAARGTGLDIVKDSDGIFYVNEKPIIYPWGNKFDPSKINSLEFWESKNIGTEIKKRYSKGLLPVHTFQDVSVSPYGLVNICGNASEWTSSWYNAYKGSKYSSKMFGRQVKVIRGGSWYCSREKVRATSREYGGIPNLYEDNIAGFRCVKDPTVIDRKW